MPEWAEALLYVAGGGGGGFAGAWAALRGQLERVRDNVHYIANDVNRITLKVEENSRLITRLRIHTRHLDWDNSHDDRRSSD